MIRDTAGPEIDSKRLMIIDDDHDILLTFKMGLESFGYVVDTFSDTDVAIEQFKDGKYDLLLIDINMPKMDGFTFFKRIQSIDTDVKACFITAFETYFEAFRETFPNLDIGCYIRKPISIADLASHVELTTLRSNHSRNTMA